MTRRLVVGISGASGVVMGVRMLQLLREAQVETHLVMSRGAQITLSHETDWKVRDVQALADASYRQEDIAAAISSGSFRTDGMVIVPCSMRTLAEVATGASTSLLTRAADVVLKERRRLVLMVRETPLHLGHLRNMVAATEIGAVVCPPVPAFYSRPRTIEELVDHSLGRVLDLFDIAVPGLKRWRSEGGAVE